MPGQPAGQSRFIILGGSLNLIAVVLSLMFDILQVSPTTVKLLSVDICYILFDFEG